MPSLLSRLRGGDTSERAANWYESHFTFNGMPHSVFPATSMPGAKAEHIGDTFEDLIHRVRDSNSVVSGAVQARALLVSQMRFAFRDEVSGRLFGSGALAPLERPGSEPRPSLLYRGEEDASYAGNTYFRRIGNSLYRLRPDWCDIVLGSNESPDDVAAGADAEVIGYYYYPNGNRRVTPQMFSTDEVMHFAPERHPLRRYIGTSWVTSLISDIIADGQASEHIRNYFEHAATANMVVKAPEGTTMEQFSRWVDNFEGAHAGAANAWRNIYVAAGTDVNVIGANLAELDLKQLTGAIEARITTRSRVPAVVLGTREGTQGSALNSGNYQQTRRLWADGWFAPYADMWCAALEQIVPPPSSFVELTYKRDRILFLQEDQKDTAEIQATKATAMRQLIDAGYEPDTVRDAITTDDYSKLRHTGLAPVQVQPVSTLPQEGASDAAA